MQRHLLHLAFALIAFTLLAASCRSTTGSIQTQELLDVSGRYHSSESVGTLGILTMQIKLVEKAQQFNVWLAGIAEEDGLSRGFGSIGDGHIILNFDRGLNSDFYFEGTVETSGEEIVALEGNFVFPDQTEPLPIRFNFVELIE